MQRKKPCRKLQSEIKIHAGYGDNPATAERKNHANSDQKHFNTHTGNKSEEPSATESEILPLHKPAVYTKGFVLRGLAIARGENFMARHSFIRMTKLTDVKGRVDYISNPKRQEHLYAVYTTVKSEFWQ